MTSLRALCDARGIQVIQLPDKYKRPWLYLPGMKVAVVFRNATEQSIKLLVETITEQEQAEIGGVAA